MGRKRSKHTQLPPRMRLRIRRKRAYYYYDTCAKPRREIPLGCDYVLAVQRWAELERDSMERAARETTFRAVAERYCKLKLPLKAPRTQRDNLVELERLYAFFDDPPAPLDAITPQHIRKYLDWRTGYGRHATTRANRERALFSAIWNFALQEGLTSRPNPTLGVTGFTERRRDVYVEDDVFDAIHDAACPPLRDAMDLAYLTGLRPSDTLAITHAQIRGGVLRVQPHKTARNQGTKVRFRVDGDLAVLVERLREPGDPAKAQSATLIANERGQRLSLQAMEKRFRKARRKAADAAPCDLLRAEILATQFRDLRAKAGTDKAAAEGRDQAQKLLAHSSGATTEVYLRNRRGELVSPNADRSRGRTREPGERTQPEDAEHSPR